MEPVAEIATSADLTITVVGATGRGPTTLAAFDDALRVVGVSNYNLIRLSSVIPPGSLVSAGRSLSSVVTDDDGDHPAAETQVDLRDRHARSALSSRWGDRLYAVWAFEGAQLLGQEAWAGVAWAQDPRDGRGLFVEHEGGSETQVRRELEASLTSICEARGMRDLDQQSVVVGTRCEGEPVAALVIAPFMSEPWAPPTRSRSA